MYIRQKYGLLIIFAIIFLFHCIYLFSSETRQGFGTPRDAVNNFFFYTKPGNINYSEAAKSFNIADKNKHPEIIAEKLKKIFDGKGLIIKSAQVSDYADYIDSASGKNKYVLFESLPGIYLEKYDGGWLFSTESINSIEKIYKDIYPWDIEELLSWLPEIAYNTFLGIELWKFTGLIFYVIFAWISYKLLSLLLGLIIGIFLARWKFKEIVSKHLKKIKKPLALLIVIWIFFECFPLLYFPAAVNRISVVIFKILQPVVITFTLYRLVDFIFDILAKIAAKTKTTVDDNLLPLFGKGVKALVIIFGFAFLLQNFGIDVTLLLAGVSVVGLAIALAAQETVKNLFGSLTVAVDRPFDIGDWVVFDGNEGNVEEIGLRSTRIRTFYNSLISVPNGKLADMIIDNMGARKQRRFRMKIGITYDTPPILILTFVEGLRRAAGSHPKIMRDAINIYLNDFADSSIVIIFNVFLNVEDIPSELNARQEILLRIIELADALGVRFAFMTQTLHIEEIPGKPSLTPEYSSDGTDFQKKLDEFFKNKEMIENGK